MSLIRERKDCRACGGKLESILDLGEQKAISFGDKEVVKAPLHLMKCDSCHLVQLKHTLDQDYLFRKYYYRSGTNQTMRNHLRGIVEEVTRRVTLNDDDVVVDIGANDGTLLSNYQVDVWKVGFEPATNIIPEIGNSFPFRNGKILGEFFTERGYFSRAFKTLSVKDVQQAKVITAIAMFYDLDDPNAFLQDIKKVLAPDGLFVIEQNYLPTMLKNNAVDNICHEHLCYYSLHTLDALLEANDLQIFDVEFSDINGGVFRAYIRHRGDGTHPIIVNPAPWQKERALLLDTLKPYQDFANKVRENAYKLGSFILTRPSQGETVMVYGPSTRGATLMQLAGLGDGGLVSGRKKGFPAIQAAVDRNPEKVGTKYLGIPVISEEQARQNPPNYLLVLPYSFLPEFVQREKPILMSGGAFIIPCPEPWKLQGGPL